MVVKLTRLLTFDEYVAMGHEAVANGYWRNDRRIFTPGMGWFNNWYWDPEGKRKCMVREAGTVGFLSRFYWRDWAHKRAPIEIICPDGSLWCPDRKSSNGEGWEVTGEWPNLTAAPSIDTGPYHGFLRNGEFSSDLSGKTEWPLPADYGPPPKPVPVQDPAP